MDKTSDLPLQNIKVGVYQSLLLPCSPSVGCSRLLFLDTRHFVGTSMVLAVAFSLAWDCEMSVFLAHRRRRAVRFRRGWLRHFKMVVDESW